MRTISFNTIPNILDSNALKAIFYTQDANFESFQQNKRSFLSTSFPFSVTQWKEKTLNNVRTAYYLISVSSNILLKAR